MASTTSGIAVAGVVDRYPQARRPDDLDPADERQARDQRPVDGRGRLDLDDVPADRLPPEVVGIGERDEPAVGDQCDAVARLRLAHVLGRDQEGSSGVAEPMELIPDPRSKERVDPGRRLVEEEQRRVVDECTGELEAALHPARQRAGAPTADLPEVDELEDLARAAPATRPEHAEQRGDEVDVLPRRQVRVEGE